MAKLQMSGPVVSHLYVMLVGAYPFEDPSDPRNFRKTIQVGRAFFWMYNSSELQIKGHSGIPVHLGL